MKKEITTTTSYNAFTPYQKYNNGNLSINRINTILYGKKESAKATNNGNNYNGLDTSELYTLYASGDDSSELLIEMGTRIAYSVVKKLIDVSYNETLVDVRKTITKAIRDIKNIERLNSTIYSLGYNEDGDSVRIVNSKKEEEAFNKITLDNLGVGYDLVQDAILAILEETRKHSRDLQETFTERRLKGKVYIKYDDSVNGWEDVETTPIQDIYKAVRKEISDNGSISVANSKYVYIEDYSFDNESGEGDFFFRRLGKYSDLGGYAMDFNGSFTTYSADEAVVEDMDELVEALNLTDRQTRVLQLRLKGYGQKAIATYLGVSKQAIQKTMKQIQKKAISIGLSV